MPTSSTCRSTARSLRQQHVNPRKADVIDTTIDAYSRFAIRATIDRGRLLENLVFNAVRKQDQTITSFFAAWTASTNR
jgi:hypothetical protein